MTETQAEYNIDSEDDQPDFEIDEATLRAEIDGFIVSTKLVDFADVCRAMGLTGRIKKKHAIVAIVHVLLLNLDHNALHLSFSHCCGFEIAVRRSGVVHMSDFEMQQFLIDSAINMGWPEIKVREASFMEKLWKQLVVSVKVIKHDPPDLDDEDITGQNPSKAKHKQSLLH